MSREYQYNYSARESSVYDHQSRERKARTISAILSDCLRVPLKNLTLLDVGASTGIIDRHLAEHFGWVSGIDIDAPAIEFAKKTWAANNLSFSVGDALNLDVDDESFDVVICSHVYEHVTNPERMFAEIHRVLKPGGVCYFAAGNRLMINEPHYNLPFLSLLPRQLGHLYLRLTGRGTHYHEQHLTYWGLKKLVKNFRITDYTHKIITDPSQFEVEYMIRPGSLKQKLALLILRRLHWASPGYIWILEKTQ
jgi:2-polyprenyl-3-methyl-5-hydroxy-6-metoxy-1,4-benzoquinol methylase